MIRFAGTAHQIAFATITRTIPNRQHTLLILVVWLVWLLPSLGQEPGPAATVDELQRRLTELVTQPRFSAATWGLKVTSLDSGKTVFEHNAQKLFSPASNSKLYTVALALDRLGADYRIKTSLYAKAGPNARGVLNGDLIVYGRGDPTINARVHGTNIFAALEPLVAALTNAGVKRITGNLVGDESYFQGPPFGSGWAWDDMEYYYGAEISALTINDNTFQVRVQPGEHKGDRCRLTLVPASSYVILNNQTETAAAGAKRTISFHRPLNENVIYASGQLAATDRAYEDDVTVHKPAGLFLAFFREALARHGIKVGGRLQTVSSLERRGTPLDCSQLVELGSIDSLPMADMAREVMKPSQNLYTDLLLAHVGERSRAAQTPPRETSEDLGIRELNRFLAEAGVRKGDVFFEEGSGLSRNNLTTPNATATLLEFMSRHKSKDAYYDALPIAGVDGTLRNRMKGTIAAENVRAKTGTLRWANSLSGYLKTTGGERWAFSLMLNRYHSTDTNHSARSELDAIAIMLAGFTGRTAN